jgi:hypothetical protein
MWVCRQPSKRGIRTAQHALHLGLLHQACSMPGREEWELPVDHLVKLDLTTIELSRAARASGR